MVNLFLYSSLESNNRQQAMEQQATEEEEECEWNQRHKGLKAKSVTVFQRRLLIFL
jgi:hypothetical protein